MKRFELIIGALAIVALVMKFNLVVGSGILAVLVISLLACLYWPAGFPLLNEIPLKKLFRKEIYQSLSPMRIIGSAGVGMGFSAICIGLLFKVQRWPDADQNITIGLAVVAIGLVVSIFKFRSNKAPVYQNIIVRSIIYGLIGAAVLSVTVETLERFTYRNHPMYLEVYEQHLADPSNEQLWKELDVEHHRATFSPEMFETYMEHEVK